MDIKLLLQIAGVLLGLLYLWLEYRADIRLWIVGLVMPLIHGALYYKSGLYADCSMQAYYVLAGLYGWLVWRRRGRKTDAGLTGPEDAEGAKRAAALRIGHTPLRTVPALAGVYAAAHIGLYLLLTRFTDSTVPFWDAGTTALSVVAMWMLSRKLVEQWLVWLVVDLVTVGLYLYKDRPTPRGFTPSTRRWPWRVTSDGGGRPGLKNPFYLRTREHGRTSLVRAFARLRTGICIATGSFGPLSARFCARLRTGVSGCERGHFAPPPAAFRGERFRPDAGAVKRRPG